MKKVIALLLAAAMVISVAACGGSAASADAEAPKAEAAAPAAKEEAPAADEAAPAAESTGSGKKLDVSFFRGGYADMWDELIELYKTYYPDVEVTADISDDNDVRVRARMLGDDQPDLIFISGTEEFDVNQAAASGLLYDLTDFFANENAADGRKLSEVINETTIKNATLNGGVYLPSIATYYGGWWYNKKLYDDNGWTAPTTWDEFKALAPKMVDAGVNPFIYQGLGAQGYMNWGYFYQAIAACGGYDAYRACFLDLEDGAWTSDAALEAAKRLDELVKNGWLYEGCTGMDFTQAQMEFAQNKAGLMPNGSWFETEIKDVMADGFELQMIPLPMQDKDGHSFITQFGTAVNMAAGAKNVQEALDFLGVIYSKDGQKIIAKYGQTPVVTDLSTEELSDIFTPCTLQVIEQASKGNVVFVNNFCETFYVDLYQALCENGANLMLQEITPEEFCENMEAVRADVASQDIPKLYTYDH